MIEWLSNFTAYKIKNADPENTSSLEVLIYGLKIIYNTTIIIFLSVLYGIFFGSIYDIIIALVAFALLRFFTGGHHVTNSDLCVIISVGLMVILSTIELNITSSWILNIISLVLILWFAPFGVNPHIESFKNMVRYFKYVAFLIIMLNITIVNSDVLTLAYLAQSLTLIHFKTTRGE